MTKSTISTTLLALFVAGALAAPGPSPAFFQKTTLEGPIGTDVSGIWLAVHYLLPTFRVRVDRAEEGGAPFKVGAIPAKLEPALGKDPKGVVITGFTNPQASSKYGLFEGDVITKLNTEEIATGEDFDKALATAKDWFLITVRRSAMPISKVRLVKIKYEAEPVEVDGVLEVGDEQVTFQVSEASLPFESEVDAVRQKGEFFMPTAKHINELKESWYRLPRPDQPVFAGGEHRVVAADSYDSALRQDSGLADTRFAVVSTLKGNPLSGGGGQNISIYGVREIGGDKMSGTFVDTTMASAPFPISIEFNGTFVMTKVAPYSNKDVEYVMAQNREAAEKQRDEENRTIEIAPDVPKDLPAPEENPPAVAE